MKLFGKIQAPNPTMALTRSVESQLKSDRDFWEEMVRMQLDEGAQTCQVETICKIADALVIARRERFPVEG